MVAIESSSGSSETISETLFTTIRAKEAAGQRATTGGSGFSARCHSNIRTGPTSDFWIILTNTLQIGCYRDGEATIL